MASAGGVVYRDLLPLPDNAEIASDPKKKEESHSLAQEPTASHALAMADHDEKGHAQLNHDNEVKDLGWNARQENIPKPLVGGMDNEELWVLIRRFNKQMYHVKEYPHPVPGNLDLNIADEEEFSPDKLRANIERLYMTVIIGLIGFGKQIARLRSWRETRRTACFCTAYFVAWIFDLIVPLFALTMIVLIAYPPSRTAMFPPAPLALVDRQTGGVQKPKAGVLGSHDSATGAPENHKGEAVEAEASNFWNSIASVALGSAAGENPKNTPPVAEMNATDSPENLTHPTTIAATAGNARTSADGGKTSAEHDKTKVPMEAAMWSKMRPIMHGIADVSDTWERFGNALSPTPPFPTDIYPLRLAAVVVPLLGISIFVTSYMVVKGVTFGVGVGFFGDPVMQPVLRWLNKNYPQWQKLLELRNSVLKGVPTNAQLTITLLRIGEANKAPLPPPPYNHEPPPNEPAVATEHHLRANGEEYSLDATDEELKAAVEHNPDEVHGSNDLAAAKDKSHHKRGSRILSMFKTSVKGTVETGLGADYLKAKAGSDHSKQRLGVIPGAREGMLSGPVDFKCRYHGKKGHAYISASATIPCISFSLDKSIGKSGIVGKDDEELHPVWSVAVADIKELKKVGGLGWKAKLVVGWALNREVADGIEIVDKQGNRWLLTAMLLRDELFNRLVAMDGQKWEAW